MSYRTVYDFYRDTARLIAGGVTLRGLFDAMLTVKEPVPIDASPGRLRDLTRHWTQSPVFVQLRLHELFGGLRVEHTDDYVLAMVGALGGRHEQEVRLFLLRQDRELREELFWRIFEVEGGGEISLANVDKFSREELNWQNTVVLLTGEGTLDRRRLLRCCLEALNRDFSAYRAGWFSRVYTALEPTAVEAAADQDLLRLCLGSSVTATVSLGVKQLAAVQRAGLLEAGAFVEACTPALTGPKAAATTVVRMLAALATTVGIDPVAEALVLGLGHPHADVQRAAVKALTALGRVDLALEHCDELTPAVAAELLPRHSPATPEPISQKPGDSGQSRAIDTQPADSARFVQEGSPAFADPGATAVLPWRDEDAVERFAVLLEDPADALEVELALAWLATAERPADTLAPLVKRATKIQSHRDAYWIAQLLAVADDPSVEYLPRTFWQDEPRPTEEQTSVLPSFVARLREVATILRGRTPRRPLLATPTDSAGWIDPAAFRTRYLTAAATRADPLPVDLTQALLRLPPDFPSHPTTTMPPHPPTVTPPHPTTVIPAKAGISPSRDDVLAEFGLTMPPVTPAIRIEWRSRGSDTLKANGEPRWVWWDPVLHAERATTPSVEQPGLIPSTPADRWRSYRGTNDLVTAELGFVHPHSTLPLVAVGMTVLTSALSETAEHRADAVLATLARHPGVWTAETAQLVGLGLAAQRADQRLPAVELLAVAIPGRISPASMAEGLAACAPAVVLTRWASSFTDAATIAPATVVDVLTALLPRLDHGARGVGSLLTVLLDESLRLNRPASDAALRTWLGGFTGSSAAARTARALLA